MSGESLNKPKDPSAENLSNFDSALQEIKAKVEVGKDVAKEIGNLYEAIKKPSLSEIFESFKSIFGIAFIGMLSSKEEYETWKKEHAGKVKVTENNKSYEREVKPNQRQALVNMKAIKYYDPETKKPFENNQNRIAKKIKAKNAKPSTFILEKSSELFKEGVGSYENFKKNVADKLVDPTITDQNERERQAAVILSYCAIGNFQILPAVNFDKMGWSVEGEEGLKNIYEFLVSTDKQVDLYKKIIENLWKKYHDPGLVAVEYYSGSAKGYKNNPNHPRYQKLQYGGHISIHGYAEKIRKIYKETKEKFPNLPEVDCVKISIEKIESGGKVMEKELTNS